MKLGSTSITQKVVVASALARAAEKVVRVVQVKLVAVLVRAEGTDPQWRRTFELPMNNERDILSRSN